MKQDVRPERPYNEDVPKLSDGAWELAEKCWVKDTKSRPTASAVWDILSHLLAAITIAQPTPILTTPGQEGLSQRLILSNLQMKGQLNAPPSYLMGNTLCKDPSHFLFSGFVYYYLLSHFYPLTAI